MDKGGIAFAIAIPIWLILVLFAIALWLHFRGTAQ